MRTVSLVLGPSCIAKLYLRGTSAGGTCEPRGETAGGPQWEDGRTLKIMDDASGQSRKMPMTRWGGVQLLLKGRIADDGRSERATRTMMNTASIHRQNVQLRLPGTDGQTSGKTCRC